MIEVVNANPMTLFAQRRRRGHVLVILLFLWLVVPSFGLAQPPRSKNSSKSSGETFAESAVDAVLDKIKKDLKDLPPITKRDDDSKDAKDGGKPSAGKTGKLARSRSVESDALACHTASEALILYKILLADPELPDDDKEQAQAKVTYWQQAAADQQTRVGTRWLPKRQADTLLKEADQLVSEAVELLAQSNPVAANARLERAAKLHPEHLESVFLLGVVAFNNNDYRVANNKFQECLTRAPKHVPLLNNVAICEVQMKRYERAVTHWEKAAELDPENHDIAQNLGKFVADASSKKITPVDKRTLNTAKESYEAMLVKNPLLKADPSIGYILTELFQSGNGKAPERDRMAGIAPGVVIAPGYVLTSRTAIEGGTTFAVQHPVSTDGSMFTAKLVATSTEADVALLQAAELKVEPAIVNTVPVTLDAKILLLGFPLEFGIGKALVSAQGVPTGLPSDSTDRLLVLDISPKPGNRGGPVCDDSGRLIGVVASKVSPAVLSDGYTTVTPIVSVVSFVKKHVRSELPTQSDAKALEWSEVEGRANASAVLILIQKKT